MSRYRDIGLPLEMAKVMPLYYNISTALVWYQYACSASRSDQADNLAQSWWAYATSILSGHATIEVAEA